MSSSEQSFMDIAMRSGDERGDACNDLASTVSRLCMFARIASLYLKRQHGIPPPRARVDPVHAERHTLPGLEPRLFTQQALQRAAPSALAYDIVQSVLEEEAEEPQPFS